MIKDWTRVFKTEKGCWEWDGCRSPQGYGYMSILGKRGAAHRIVAAVFFGSLRKNDCVLHKCDNPSCINPDHLMIGTKLDNHRDMVSKNRSPNHGMTHCRNGHEFNKENTITNPEGRRQCKTCRNAWWKEYADEKFRAGFRKYNRAHYYKYRDKILAKQRAYYKRKKLERLGSQVIEGDGA